MATGHGSPLSVVLFFIPNSKIWNSRWPTHDDGGLVIKNANTIQYLRNSYYRDFLWCSFRFWSKKFEIQDGWLNMTASGMVKNATMAVSHLNSAILNFELFTSASKRASSETLIYYEFRRYWMVFAFFDHFEVGHIGSVILDYRIWRSDSHSATSKTFKKLASPVC